MSLYWFWFLFPTALSIMVTAFEIANMECKDAQPRFGLIFFIFTGMPALIPGWTAFYSGVAVYLGQVLIPATQRDTAIAEFTIFAAMFVVHVLHIIVVFPLIPVQLAKLVQRMKKA